MKVIDKEFTECPISSFDREAADVLSVINMCEGGGMGGGFSASAMMDETQYFHNVRSIILTEKNRIQKYKDRKAEMKKNR